MQMQYIFAMKRSSFCFTLITGLVFMATFNVFAGHPSRVRQPAVAGQFYTDNPSELKQEIESYLAKGKKLPSAPQILISPHAGYVFSGPVAAMGFAAVDKKVNTVFVIGPSHHALFDGVSIADADSFATPLGRVALNADIVKKLRQNKIVHSVPQADGPEHSVEVQIPFLQVVLPSFSIIPIVMGNINPAVVADLILPFITPSTLVVASSDFSHYQSNAKARSLDDQSIKTILSGDAGGAIDACGEKPIRVVMLLAKKLSLSPQLLDARTSYDTAPRYGASDRVVGYASIVYFRQATPARK
jgi:AmmeMemoRadiSam system protein B